MQSFGSKQPRMVLSQHYKDEVLSIAKINSLITEPGLRDVDFVSPNLEEQYIENEKAASLKVSSCKSNHRWRMSNLEDILESFKNGQLTFVGPAGSGKTTLVKTIAQSVIGKKYESMGNVELVFIIDHAIEENVPETGRDLIFSSLLSAGMKRKSRLSVMEYVENNPQRVLFVLDGLDTMKLEDVGTSDSVGIDDKALPAKHLGNFLAGRYLPGCRIITSGRNQILRSFDQKVHPKRVVALTGFSKTGIEKVISRCLASDRAADVIHRLQNEMKPLMSLCSSPAILKYTLCVIDTHGGAINTLTDLLMIILERLKVKSENKEVDHDVTIQDLKHLAFDGVREKDVVFSESHLRRYRLSEEQVTCLSLLCGWGSDFKLMQKRSHCFFTHMTMQEALAALYLVTSPRLDYIKFMQNKVNLSEFALVRRLLHGMLRSKGTKYNIARVADEDFKLQQLFMNDASILKEQFSPYGSPDYQEILEIFYCLYESQEMPKDIQDIIKSIELKNLPISASDAHIIGWVIRCCSKIDGISFWNCTLNSSVFETLEEAVDERKVEIRSLNIHENDGLDALAMVHIGKMAGHSNMNGMVFQGCEISPEHIMNLERNLVKIGNLIFWGRTKMRKDFRSAILPLIPKVSTYLALDMWELSDEDKDAFQNALDQLEHSELKINVYPAKNFIERRRKTIKRSLSKTISGGDPQKKRRKLPAGISSSRKSGETLVVADRMAARIDEKILQFTESVESDEFDLSYLPLSQMNAANVGNALARKQVTNNLKLRSCMTQGFVKHLQRYLTVPTSVNPPVIINVDASANREFGEDNAKSLGNLLKVWKTTSLDLSECHFTANELACLRDSTTTHVIPKLLYNNNFLTSQIVGALSSFCASSCIVTLHLGNCNLKLEHLVTLESQIQHMKLQMLDLSYNREMASIGYAAVGRTVNKSLISTVLFVNCDTVHGELQSFQIELKRKQLDHLDLSYNDELVTNDSQEAVTATLELIKPTTLTLSGCGVDGEMLKNMANSSIGAKLTRLDIRDNPKLGQDSIEVVVAIVDKLSLDSLDIDNCGWSEEDILTLPDRIQTAVGVDN